MGKFLNTVIIGAASGAAAAYFLSTEKGQQVKQKVNQAFEAYKRNPEEYHRYASQKASEYKDTAVNTFKDYKEKFETGELTKDDLVSTVKEKAYQVGDLADQTISEVKKYLSQAADKTEETAPVSKAQVDDIVIDYQEEAETSDDVNEA
ncbi:YtxH domain-containing protein [Streptococcus orisasini]|uniref:YtxH domain-containing protein n=1 Tax=Streptococcus orisasini TaxID=1080071 RepID=UPI00070A1CE4|nr:YtxH domain-containing protein [Streptococcus orisasini]